MGTENDFAIFIRGKFSAYKTQNQYIEKYLFITCFYDKFNLIKPVCKREARRSSKKVVDRRFQLVPVAKFNKAFNQYLPYTFDYEIIYRSEGLEKHIAKRHPECLPYLDYIASIIATPDYIGVNPRETDVSFELVKVLAENIQVGIKLDRKNDYLYVATVHPITAGKLQHGLENGRLMKFNVDE